MNLDLCLFTRERPEIDNFLLNRYNVEYKGNGSTMTDLMRRDRPEKRIYVIWGDDERNFVDLTIEAEARHDFYPRLAEETKIDYAYDRGGLPNDLVSYDPRGVRLIGDEKLWQGVEGTELILNPSKKYERIFRVLEWTQGKPVYYTYFATSQGNKKGLTNAVGLARVLANRFDGRIWDPINHKLGDPDVEEIVANSGDFCWLLNVFAEKKSEPHLRLIE